MKNFWSVLLIWALAAGGVQAEVFVEDWAEALNREVYHGQIGVKTATGVADILTPTEVVGVCSLKGAPDKIILLSRMADDLKLRATVIVILDEGDKLDRLDPIREQARNARVSFQLAQTLIASAPTGYQQATAKTSTKSAATTSSTATASAADSSEMTYWLNTKTGVRHNKNCRYYGKGKNGRPCTKAEGRACKICGG